MTPSSRRDLLLSVRRDADSDPEPLPVPGYADLGVDSGADPEAGNLRVHFVFRANKVKGWVKGRN
ncbi:hypothetical protein CG736_18320 [Kitasatospora sp. CB02891]|nr:hypothetical protein CG736_18320 [Kitasatospora sp. CB02891]